VLFRLPKGRASGRRQRGASPLVGKNSRRIDFDQGLHGAERAKCGHCPNQGMGIAPTRRIVMKRASRAIARLLSVKSERGVTAIEYGLIASLIALAIIVAVTLVGTNLTGLFNYIGGKVVAP
jgi:pilus assembly protein Flp/PilA